MAPADDALWDLYADALIECRISGRVHALRGPAAGALPAAPPVFVLTAYNPGGVSRDQASNDADEARLERELTANRVTFWPANGRSRDASWSEPGVAIAGLERSEACAYGGRFGQLAVYELTADEVRVVRCDGTVVRTAARRQ